MQLPGSDSLLEQTQVFVRSKNRTCALHPVWEASPWKPAASATLWVLARKVIMEAHGRQAARHRDLRYHKRDATGGDCRNVRNNQRKNQIGMNTIATEDNQKTNIGAKLESAIDKAKDACERLEQKTVAAAKAADKAVRTHPYRAMGIVLGFGLLVGVIATRRPLSQSASK